MGATVYILKGSANNIFRALSNKIRREYFTGNLQRLSGPMAGRQLLVAERGLFDVNGNMVPYSEKFAKNLYRAGVVGLDLKEINSPLETGKILRKLLTSKCGDGDKFHSIMELTNADISYVKEYGHRMPITWRGFSRSEGGLHTSKYFLLSLAAGLVSGLIYGDIVNPEAMQYFANRLADLDFSFDGESFIRSLVAALKDTRLWGGLVISALMFRVTFAATLLTGNFKTPTKNSLKAQYATLQSFLCAENKEEHLDEVAHTLQSMQNKRTARKFIDGIADKDIREALEEKLKSTLNTTKDKNHD